MDRQINQNNPSELRLDLVSKDWVVVATGRAKRPETFKKEKRMVQETDPKECPFCQIKTQKPPTEAFNKGKKVEFEKGTFPKRWTTIAVPNKYPAFSPSKELNRRTDGMHQFMDAVGFHEVVITKSHKKQLGQMDENQIKEVINVYQQRYLEMMNDPLVAYVSIFHNHGVEAGASIAHPHSQIIAVPVFDPDLSGSLENAKNFYQENKKCAYCHMNEQDSKDGRRVIFENENFVAICPFASHHSFEISISPKKHNPYFERMDEKEKDSLAEIFQVVLKKMFKGLGDPAYNFYLHTAPCDGGNYDHYHWHFVIIPKTSTWAGFEFGAGMEISTIEPEKAAEYLRRQ